MKDVIFTGSAVALITPFNDDLTINYDKVEELVEMHIANKTDAVLVAATTGESATLTYNEHKELVEFVVRKVNHRIPVLAGTGSNSTVNAIRLTQDAKDAGADGVVMVTPFYNKTTQKGLLYHYQTVANNVAIPIIVYNVPSRTGLNIEPKTYYQLSKIPNIVGTKEANGNLSSVAETLALCGENLPVYSGNDDQIVPILSLGGKGVISVLANIRPELTHNICQKYFEGNIRESACLQLDNIALIKALFSEVNPIPVKEAMNQMGMKVGGYRAPLFSMEDATKNHLIETMKDAFLI